MIPVMLLILLGVVGIFYADVQVRRAQDGIDVLADLAAADPGESWKAKVPGEDVRTGCHADPLMPTVEYPDGGAEPGNRILLRWFCHLRTRWLFDGLPLTVESEAVIAAPR